MSRCNDAENQGCQSDTKGPQATQKVSGCQLVHCRDLWWIYRTILTISYDMGTKPTNTSPLGTAVGLLHCQVVSCCKCPSSLQRSNLDLGVNNSNSLTWRVWLFGDRCPYNCHHSGVRSHHPAWFEEPRNQWLTNHSGTCGSKAELPRADSTFIWILPSSSWKKISLASNKHH